jgi:hypothetical protein
MGWKWVLRSRCAAPWRKYIFLSCRLYGAELYVGIIRPLEFRAPILVRQETS